jgi:hypothetical protein
VEPSEEIRRIVDRLIKAIAEGDKESALGRLSEQPGTLIIGSDPAEWWRGHETRAVWGRQIEEFDGSFLVAADEIDAWEEGSVGWASVKETIAWEGKTIEGRASYILHLEHDEWKIVHIHWSFPQPHLEVLGKSLSAGNTRMYVMPTGKDGLPMYFNPFLNPFGSSMTGMAQEDDTPRKASP